MDQHSGWYPDPDGTPGQLRWWDGDRWTDLTTSGPTPERHADGPEGVAGSGEDVMVGAEGAPLGDRIRLAVDRRLGSLRGGRRTAGTMGTLLVMAVVVGLLAWHVLLPNGAALSTAGSAPSSSAVPPAPPRPVPPLAASCKVGQPTPEPGPTSTVPPGPRINDVRSGISYAAMGAPWKPWDQFWFDPRLGVRYRDGYYLITQQNVGGAVGNDYYATVLSGSVPATFGDALHPDMACVAHQLADDVRASFYPQPNTRQALAERAVEVDGHPGYLVKFHLAFDAKGYTAKGELAEVLVLDVGTPRVAVLYVSIPDTHKQYDRVADTVVASVSVP